MPEPTSNERRPLLLIADSHVRSGKNSFGAFFQMLSWIETTNYDVGDHQSDEVELFIAHDILHCLLEFLASLCQQL